MEETAWDTALAPHPAGCCKDRAAAWPDPCNGRGVGHVLRGPAGSGAIGIDPVAEGLGAWGWMAGLLWTRWLTGLCSSERLRLGAVSLGYGALSLQDWQEAADAQGQDLYPSLLGRSAPEGDASVAWSAGPLKRVHW